MSNLFLEGASSPVRQAAAAVANSAANIADAARGDLHEHIIGTRTAQDKMQDAIDGLVADVKYAIPLVDRMWHGKIPQLHTLIMAALDDIAELKRTNAAHFSLATPDVSDDDASAPLRREASQFDCPWTARRSIFVAFERPRTARTSVSPEVVFEAFEIP